ncbi:methyltransferase domain-containing protein [Microlunatus speluncae]|uniref:methyltransferase domain-containing protein n=1 Tax=Microlunatus speluncae TaxID=2594267 RepID=UPI0012667C47|nr:methyltransferase domain-containing protein [Microlunatus speluncae]
MITDRLEFRTIGGAEELLVEELRDTGLTELTVAERRVTGTLAGDPELLPRQRLFSAAALPLGDAAEPDLAPLTASIAGGMINTLVPADRPATFRVGHDSAEIRAALTERLVEGFGWVNDPSDWLINLTRYGERWLAELGPLHWTRRFGRLERLPWSSTPVLAATLVRLAKIGARDRVVDPFCGSGTLLLLAGLGEPGTRLTGSDLDPEAIRLATINLERFGVTAALRAGPAERIELGDHSADRVLANLPFGKRVGSHRSNEKLYPAALREVARILDPRGRAVLLTDDKRLFLDALQRTGGIKIIRERVLTFGGVSPTAYVITPTAGRRKGSRR